MTANKEDEVIEEGEDEDDYKEVIKILNDQILKKSNEISALKKTHNDEKTSLELDFAQTKIKLAECKTSIEDLEEFIEI